MAPNCREFRFESGLPANKHFERTYNDKAINHLLQYAYSVTTQERIEKECILSMCKRENLFLIVFLKLLVFSGPAITF